MPQVATPSIGPTSELAEHRATQCEIPVTVLGDALHQVLRAVQPALGEIERGARRAARRLHGSTAFIGRQRRKLLLEYRVDFGIGKFGEAERSAA